MVKQPRRQKSVKIPPSSSAERGLPARFPRESVPVTHVRANPPASWSASARCDDGRPSRWVLSRRHVWLRGGRRPVGKAIGEILPLAVALAAGPLPIIAILLILVSEDVIFSVIGDPALGHRDHPRPAMSVARIVIGVLAIALAGRMWRRRNEPSRPSLLTRRVGRADRQRFGRPGPAGERDRPGEPLVGVPGRGGHRRRAVACPHGCDRGPPRSSHCRL